MKISIFWDHLLEDQKKREELANYLKGRRIVDVRIFDDPVEGPDFVIVLDNGAKIMTSGNDYDLWVEASE